MSDDSPRPLPTWEEFASAQAGRWFFLKWMLVGGAMAAGYSLVWTFSPANYGGGSRYGPLTMLGCWLCLGLAQGGALFPGHLRTWLWCIAWCLTWFATEPTLGAHWAALFISTAQMLLLLRVRRRAALWLLFSEAGLEGCSWVWDSIWEWSQPFNGWLSAINWLPRWISGPVIAFTAGTSVYFLLTGAALAWLMPPVAPRAGASANPATE